MRRKDAKLTTHITLLVDSVSMIIAFVLAAYIRGGILNSGNLSELYVRLLIVLVISYFLFGSLSLNKDIFKRGYFVELICVIKDQSKQWLIILAYMFAVKQGGEYSRIFLSIFFLLNILFTYVMRSYMKIILLLTYKKSSSSSKVMLITVSKNAVETIRKIRREYEWQIYMTSIALWDKDRIGEEIEGVEVIANRDNVLEMAKLNVVDEVLIHIPRKYSVNLEELILEFEKMGIIVHVYLDFFNNMNLKEKMIEDFAGHQVITFASGLFEEKHVIMKRMMDLIGGFIGFILTIIITIVLAPAIFIESPGPIFFSQIRIGKNGRKFRIYKFRSMYRDAELRKKELMGKNEMKGLMFKMTDDPRITKVGNFIRKTSLDEFPQFINVLKGDMSLVGTRPPTLDEFELYESRHKRRLSLKPGLTGLWQVSGRSDIQDFEEVVKLDLEYIDNWSMMLDLKLLLKTVIVVVFGKGSR